MTWNYFGATTPHLTTKSGSLTPYLEHVAKASQELVPRLVIIPNSKIQLKLEKGLREIGVEEIGIGVKEAMEFVLDAKARSLQNAGDPSTSYQEAVADVVWGFFAGYEEGYDADSGLIHFAVKHAQGNGGMSIIELDHRANQLISLLQEDAAQYARDFHSYVARSIMEYPEYVITAEFVRFLNGGYAVYVGEPNW